MQQERLQKYAELIAKCGLNVRKGQEVIIRCGLDQPEFVATVVEECYKLGAERVKVEWSYMPITKLNYNYRTLESLSDVTDVEKAEWQRKLDKLPCLLWLDSDDPDGLSGTDSAKIAKANMARFPVIKPYREALENRYQWCIAAVPGAEWAKKVFPGLPEAEATERLWEAILNASRVDGDPIKAWEKHNAELSKYCKLLNDYKFKYLEYESSNGTCLKIGLNPRGRFAGGGETTLPSAAAGANLPQKGAADADKNARQSAADTAKAQPSAAGGVYFNPNIPSEEVFTTPLRGVAEGKAVATKPLSYQGKLIENFWVRFEGGKVVEVYAEKNQDVLEKMVAMDEGAAYLGEVALIGYDSPINNTGILFYNTLFDENASCHLALGRGFNECLSGFENMTAEEIEKAGVNNSMIHVDFMIGSRDLRITGVTEEGEKVPVFVNGDWAI